MNGTTPSFGTLLACATLSALASCLAPAGGDSGANADAAPPVAVDAGGNDAAVDSALGEDSFDAVTPQPAPTGAIVEDVVYRSGGLRIRGRVCRPDAPGRYPILVVNHGGAGGWGSVETDACTNGALAGYVVALSQYRGEGGSEGQIELCLGEVDDVMNLLLLVGKQAYADATRAGMMGWSHGGCITVRAIERGAPVVAAVDYFGTKNAATLFDFMVTHRDAAPPDVRTQYDALMVLIEAATGGTPTTAAAAYTARSPDDFTADVDAFPGSLLTIQGADDPIVPLQQACAFYDKVGGELALHVTTTNQVTTQAPASCPSTAGLTWQSAAPGADGWSGRRYFLVYDAMAHELTSDAAQRASQQALGFLKTKLPPGR